MRTRPACLPNSFESIANGPGLWHHRVHTRAAFTGGRGTSPQPMRRLVKRAAGTGEVRYGVGMAVPTCARRADLLTGGVWDLDMVSQMRGHLTPVPARPRSDRDSRCCVLVHEGAAIWFTNGARPAPKEQHDAPGSR